MKKFNATRFLFLSIFFIFIKCDRNSELLSNEDDCQYLQCNQSYLNDFIINISVSMTPYDNNLIESISDVENYFGVLQDATDNYDSEYDILEPPSNPGNWISLYFPHPEWENDLGNNFTQDIRSNTLVDSSNQIIQWDFIINSNAYGTIDLNFKSVDNYCYSCIKSIQIISENYIYNYQNIDLDSINISEFLQQNQDLSFNLILTLH